MGYFLSFLVGGFIGMLITCCVVVGKDNRDNKKYNGDNDENDEIDISL